MEATRIQNADLIRELVTEDATWEYLREDSFPPKELWQANVAMPFYVLRGDSGDVHGILTGSPVGTSVFGIRMVMRPQYWGASENVALGRLGCKSLAEDIGVPKLVTLIPTFELPSLKFHQRVGFKREGICRSSFLRDAELHDQYHMGVLASEL